MVINYRAETDLSPPDDGIRRFLIRQTATIRWGASATLAPYVVSTRIFLEKLTGRLLAGFFTKKSGEKPEEKCKIRQVIPCMWIRKTTLAGTSSQRNSCEGGRNGKCLLVMRTILAGSLSLHPCPFWG
jgi:hypothetical protein